MINQIIQGDNLKILKQIPNEFIDLVLTSPPYNLGNNHHTQNKKHHPYDDNLPEIEYQNKQIEILNELYRIIKKTGSILYNHKNRIKNGKQITPYEWILKTNFVVKQELIWINGSPNFDKIRFYPFTERIYWLSKTPKTKLNNVISHTDYFTSSEWKPVGTKRKHTRAFPIELAKDLISCFPSANIILDPFAGSGTTCVAAKQLNRQYIGIDINQEYCDVMQQRLNEVKRPQRPRLNQ